MFAAVDLGSNSFRLHIGNHDGEIMRVMKSARAPIRLAAGLDGNGCLTEQAMQVALESLSHFRTILDTYVLDAVRVVATNTLRIAKNASVFLPLAEKAIGYPIEIISGEEEGRLIYIGVTSMLATPDEKRLVLDIGGGSTELILGKGQKIIRVESFSIGSVQQSLSFFSSGRIDTASFNAAILSARSYFEDAALPYHSQYWSNAYGSSGTIRAIAEAIAKNNIGNGHVSSKNLEALKLCLIQYGQVNRINLAGIKPDRAAVIVGGLAILIALTQELGIETLTPIEAGLRMGVLWDLQFRATQRDRREQSVHDFLERFHADEARAKKVADMASMLYRQLKPGSNVYDRVLYWSGLLHEIGMALSQTDYHKHGAYLAENADLPGFTTREQRTMGILILGQKGNLRKLNGPLSDPDFAKAVLALRLSVLFMHAHIDVDFDELRLKMKNKIELDIKRYWIEDYPTIAYWMEKERAWWNEVGTDFSLKINA